MTADRDVADALRDKRVLVTGGTGSFGHQIVRDLLAFNAASIHIYSRDEKKQYDMAALYKDRPNIVFQIGDVRSLERTREALRDIDIVFHAAALKQVPSCEYAPIEAVQTNILGAQNVRRAAIEAGVETVVSISTDKAVKPVNVMGMSKAIQERIMLDPTFNRGKTRFICVRYGNVLGSRGSVVPLFYDYIQKALPLPITHPDMTRFQLTLREAVRLVFWATVNGTSGDLWVQKMPAARIPDLGSALAFGMTGRADYPLSVVGMRPGEKLHEVLVSEEEMWRATELENHFLISSWADPQGRKSSGGPRASEYSSFDARRLSQDEIVAMLEAEGWFGPGAKGRAAHGVEIIEG